MLRNEHAPDGTLAPIRGVARDANIAVVGGRWEDYPLSHLAVVGPKSCCLPGANGEPGTEYFDPYVSCRVGTVTVEGLKVHGRTPAELVRATAFDDVNRDGRSSGRGVIGRCQFR